MYHNFSCNSDDPRKKNVADWFRLANNVASQTLLGLRQVAGRMWDARGRTERTGRTGRTGRARSTRGTDPGRLSTDYGKQTTSCTGQRDKLRYTSVRRSEAIDSESGLRAAWASSD